MTANDPAHVHQRMARHRRQRREADTHPRDTAKEIRDFVERAHDSAHAQQLGARLLGLGTGTGSDDDDDDDDDDTDTGTTSSDDDDDTSTTGGTGDDTSTTGTHTGTGGHSTTDDEGLGGHSTSSDDDPLTRITSSSSTTDPKTTSASTTSSSTRTIPTTSSTSSSSSSTSSSSSSTSSSTSFSATRTSSSSTALPTTDSSTRTSSTAVPSTTAAATTAAPTSNSLTTSVQVITQSASSAIASASSTGTGDNDGPGVGPIIGIVAAALAGVVILAAAVGFIVKKYSRKNDEPSPFGDTDEFRRQSVMLPEGFDSDDGHPSMSEHHNYSPSYGGESGMAAFAGGAAATGAASSAYGASNFSHNEGGGPRPPTMFARHADAHAANMYGNMAPGESEAPPMPTVGAVFNSGPSPQLPPMAFGGEDPYSMAGVAGGLQHNVSNPYAHLDRSASTSQYPGAGGYYGHNPAMSQNSFNGGAGAAAGMGMASMAGMGMGMGALERNGSQGSTDRAMSPTHQQARDEYQDTFETSGRPGTAEGRSGTPDIPNMQQTYAMGSDDDHSAGGAGSGSGSGSPTARHSGLGDYDSPRLANPHDEDGSDAGRDGPSAAGSGAGSPPSPAALQVRNFTGSGNARLQPNAQGTRPNSTVSSMMDDDAAYGGVY